MSDVHTLQDNEIDIIVYYREFKEWYAALSAPARRTLATLPATTQLFVADRSITHRLAHEIGESFVVTYAPTSFQEFNLVAA